MFQLHVFYLRMLLKNRMGALSFEDLRTIDGKLHKTFKSACVSLGLCENDKHWVDSLNDAVSIAMPYSIRYLFCNILVHCKPADPLALFDQFRHAMSEDFLRDRKKLTT